MAMFVAEQKGVIEMSLIKLLPVFFTDRERIFYSSDDFTVSLFRYESGVEAVKISNSLGYIVVLPYMGQMIWEACFCGQSIGMKSKYTQPKRVKEFFETDGCYLMHCGPRRICEFDDKYGLVLGELPIAEYDEACLIIDEDERGKFAAVSGSYVYNKHRGDQYVAEPIARVYSDSSVIKVTMKITNTSGYPMDYMFLFHTNNRARDGGRFVQPLHWDRKDMSMFVPLTEDGLVPDSKVVFREFQKDPAALRQLGCGTEYLPEFCIHLNNPVADEEGMYHFMQVDPDGSADYTGVPADGPLNIFARWLTRGADHSAVSLCQPSSCGIDGHDKEKAAGHVPSIQPGDSLTATVYMGLLKPDEAAVMEKKILSLID
ncbi:MAG: hypothetical protein K5771_09530 [Oscillospiraceae bacterium]|nr:hypothetical protein [Oscillospiraceae bacterium]